MTPQSKENNVNPFLRLVTRKIAASRPLVPSNMGFALTTARQEDGDFIELWLRTSGCLHSRRGGCTVCDYWVSGRVPSDEMVQAARAGMREVTNRPSLLLLQTSGSFLDPLEVPPSARTAILREAAALRPNMIGLETRADTVSDEVIAACLREVAPIPLCVEVGVESMDPWVLRYCVNKSMLPVEVEQAASILKRQKVRSVANILIGIPFLSPKEMLVDVGHSLRRAFSLGFDYCVLFPVNTKQFTLARWLEDNGLYSRPSLWALVDVLEQMETTHLDRVNIAWYAPRDSIHPLLDLSSIRCPTTCDICHAAVVGLLDAWRSAWKEERAVLLNTLRDYTCECRVSWREECHRTPKLALRDRLANAYKTISQSWLSDNEWRCVGRPLLVGLPENQIAPT